MGASAPGVLPVDAIIKRLLASPYGHTLKWINDGKLHMATILVDRDREVTIVAPTFDESVNKALDIADDMATAPTRPEVA